MKVILRDLCKCKGIKIIEGQLMPGHVHILCKHLSKNQYVVHDYPPPNGEVAHTIRSPPQKAMLAFSFAGGRGNCGGRLIFWGGIVPAGPVATLKLPHLAGGRGFHENSHAKAFPHVGAGVPLKLSR